MGAGRVYADELRDLARRTDSGVHTVFSRRSGDERRYVQHELLARHDEVWNMLDHGAAVFVCDNANTIAPGV